MGIDIAAAILVGIVFGIIVGFVVANRPRRKQGDRIMALQRKLAEQRDERTRLYLQARILEYHLQEAAQGTPVQIDAATQGMQPLAVRQSGS